MLGQSFTLQLVVSLRYDAPTPTSRQHHLHHRRRASVRAWSTASMCAPTQQHQVWRQFGNLPNARVDEEEAPVFDSGGLPARSSVEEEFDVDTRVRFPLQKCIIKSCSKFEHVQFHFAPAAQVLPGPC